MGKLIQTSSVKRIKTCITDIPLKLNINICMSKSDLPILIDKGSKP